MRRSQLEKRLTELGWHDTGIASGPSTPVVVAPEMSLVVGLRASKRGA